MMFNWCSGTNRLAIENRCQLKIKAEVLKFFQCLKLWL